MMLKTIFKSYFNTKLNIKILFEMKYQSKLAYLIQIQLLII